MADSPSILKINAEMLGLDRWVVVVHVEMRFEGVVAHCHCETIAGEIKDRAWIRDLKRFGFPRALIRIARAHDAETLVVWSTPVNRRIRKWMLAAGGEFFEPTQTKIRITRSLIAGAGAGEDEETALRSSATPAAR